MIAIFYDMIGHFMEVYVDDITVKSKREGKHVDHLRRGIEKMSKHKLRLNLLKYVFGVKVWNFLGFLVHHRGIKIDKNKTKSIMLGKPSQNKKNRGSL